MTTETPVILSAVRTPIGKFQGGLAGFSAPELGAKAVAEAIRRAGLDSNQIDEAILGNVVQAGLGQNPARQAALKGGCAPRVAAMTINKVCGHRRHARSAAPLERRLARGILAEAGLHYVAENGFVNLIRIEAGAANGFGDRFGAKLRRGKSGETALKFSDGRSNSGENDGSFGGHGRPPAEQQTSL